MRPSEEKPLKLMNTHKLLISVIQSMCGDNVGSILSGITNPQMIHSIKGQL